VKKILGLAVLLVTFLLPIFVYAGDCPNKERLLKAAVKFEQVVDDYYRLARSGRIESRESMYGSSTSKLDALRTDARRMAVLARAMSGSAEDRAALKRSDGKDISAIAYGCSFPRADMARLREDFEAMNMEISRELSPQRTTLKRNWRQIEDAYRSMEDASENASGD